MKLDSIRLLPVLKSLIFGGLGWLLQENKTGLGLKKKYGVVESEDVSYSIR